jgi:uncharacterized protein (DUF302 family)
MPSADKSSTQPALRTQHDDGFINALAGRIKAEDVEPLYVRLSATLVRPGKSTKHQRICRPTPAWPSHSCGLWRRAEWFVGGYGRQAAKALRSNIKVFGANSAEAKKTWRQVEPQYRIYRDTGIALTERGKQKPDAIAFKTLSAGAKGAAIFAKWGWVTTAESVEVKQAMAILPSVFAVIAVAYLTGAHAMAVHGLVTIPSKYGPEDTINRLEAAVRAKGMIVFARVDHAAGAAAVGLSLRPTDLLVFGNAKGGTPLMQLDQTVGIDLPLKALVWQDSAGKTWLSYDDPNWIAKRHELGPAAEVTQKVLTAVLKAVTSAATAPR